MIRDISINSNGGISKNCIAQEIDLLEKNRKFAVENAAKNNIDMSELILKYDIQLGKLRAIL